MRKLTKAQVRRAHIAAQGLAAPRPKGTPGIGHVRRAIRTMGVLQIDSVNVVERAHQLTLFSRLGSYDPDLLWRALREREIFECWSHMASFLPITDWPLYKHRMEGVRIKSWRAIRRLQEEAPGYVESVYDQLVERGPLKTSDLADPGAGKGPWWGWADGKHVLEWLFESGRAAVAERRNFTRYYDIAERVIPDEYRNAAAVPEGEAHRTLLERAAEKMVVGTAKGLADYFRLPILPSRAAVADMTADGTLLPVEVEGWKEPAFMHPMATIPRRVHARALLNPFDPIVWYRDRTEALYDFRYRVEIYVPKPQRQYGYYVFPFLVGDELVARVDIKADRKAGVLLVPGAFLEEGQDEKRVARELTVELREMAGWLGLTDIKIGRKGDLASALRTAVRS